MKKPRRRFGVPRSIKIKNKRWKIFIEPETSAFRKQDADGRTLAEEKCLGMCYRNGVNEIHLAKELKGRRLEAVFMHEILHASMPDAPILSYELEERVVEELSIPLASVLGRLIRKTRGRR